MNRRKNRNPLSFSWSLNKKFSYFHVSWVFVIYGLYNVRCSFIPNLLRVSIMNACYVFSNAFWWHVIFYLLFYQYNILHVLICRYESSLHRIYKSHLVMVYNSVGVFYWIWFAIVLLRIFTYMLIRHVYL